MKTVTRVLLSGAMLLFLFGCSRAPVNKPAEVCIINNTYHNFIVQYNRGDSAPEYDTLRWGGRLSYRLSTASPDTAALREFIKNRFVKITDGYQVDWLPRIHSAKVWNHISIPGKDGMDVYFILMNRNDDNMARLQELGMIRLFRIASGLAYFLVLTTIIGLFYLKTRHKWIMIVLVMFMNFPVIHYTADFGVLIRPMIDPLFLFPRWLLESTKYYVGFSIPLGAMLVWVLLIFKRIGSLR